MPAKSKSSGFVVCIWVPVVSVYRSASPSRDTGLTCLIVSKSCSTVLSCVDELWQTMVYVSVAVTTTHQCLFATTLLGRTVNQSCCPGVVCTHARKTQSVWAALGPFPHSYTRNPKTYLQVEQPQGEYDYIANSKVAWLDSSMQCTAIQQGYRLVCSIII